MIWIGCVRKCSIPFNIYKVRRDVNAIMDELKANMIPNAVMVPAGIVTLNRAQERGYSASSCG